MFKGLLPDNINIYAVASTFSNAEYCYDEAKVNDTLIGTCLGTQFSCRFMEDIDAKSDDDLNNYSFQDQYEYSRLNNIFPLIKPFFQNFVMMEFKMLK